jgi:hypothetical protein
MSRFDHSELDLGPDAAPGEPEALLELADRLERERPIPSTGFRGELRRQLLSRVGSRPLRPQRLGALIGAYTGSGAVLLAVAVLGIAGVGPLAAG